MNYLYIAAWHYLTGSRKYYVDARIAEAVKDNAPPRAVYKSCDTRQWVTLDDVQNTQMVERCERWVADYTRAIELGAQVRVQS